MTESYTPREFIDKINAENPGPVFDPYGVEGLVIKQQEDSAGPDLLARAKAEVAKEKAKTPEAQIALVKAQIEDMENWIEKQRAVWVFPDLRFEGDVEVKYDPVTQEVIVHTENISLMVYEGNGLVLPEHIDGNVVIRGLATEKGADGLKLPLSISGSLSLEYLKTTNGLELPRTIGGTLTLHSLTFANGLEFPNAIGQTLDLRGLTDIEGLKLPKEIGRSLYLNSIEKAEDLEFPERIPWNLGLDSLISITGLELPKSVGNDLNLNSLTSASGLKFPDSIGGNLYLDSLTSAERNQIRAQRPDLAYKIIPNP